ncbi:MAG TPA: hypothetical protein VN641_14740 [Urbifossiella sp.]|nr:hypothetical protein [Urbifossiella sp.]
MSAVIIRRCPVCPAIDSHANTISLALLAGFGLRAQIEDGNKDEFSILVDGVTVLTRTDTALPCVEEVEAAVQAARPVNKSVTNTGTVHQTVPIKPQSPASSN